MKTQILLLISFLSMSSFGQNLIDNSSFEEISACPNSLAQLSNSLNWSSPANTLGTPDYFNSCTTVALVGVPQNNAGIQEAYNGSSYVGICTIYYDADEEFREYIQTHMNSPMIAGQAYLVSFFVSLAENPQLGSNNIGVYFSESALEGNGAALIDIEPHINWNSIVTDKSGWTEITGIYTAMGGEEYITIGNFKSDNETETVVLSGIWQNNAYYYLDMVSVSPTNLDTNHISMADSFNIFPNPVTDKLFLNYSNKSSVKQAEIYTNSRKLLSFENAIEEIDFSLFSSGLYFLIVTDNSGKKSIQKIIKR